MKLIKILSISIIIVIMLITKAQAVSVQLEMFPETEEYDIGNNELVIINLKLSNFINVEQDTVLGCYAELEYDTQLLSLVDIEGKNGWNSEFDKTTNKIVLDTDNVKENDVIAQIKFDINEENILKDENNILIELKNVVITDGYFRINTEAQTTFNVLSDRENKDEPQQITQIYTESAQKLENSKLYATDETVLKNKTLPFVGNNLILILVIGMLLVLMIIFKIKSRKIKY